MKVRCSVDFRFEVEYYFRSRGYACSYMDGHVVWDGDMTDINGLSKVFNLRYDGVLHEICSSVLLSGEGEAASEGNSEGCNIHSQGDIGSGAVIASVIGERVAHAGCEGAIEDAIVGKGDGLFTKAQGGKIKVSKRRRG